MRTPVKFTSDEVTTLLPQVEIRIFPGMWVRSICVAKKEKKSSLFLSLRRNAFQLGGSGLENLSALSMAYFFVFQAVATINVQRQLYFNTFFANQSTVEDNEEEAVPDVASVHSFINDIVLSTHEVIERI